MIWPGSVVFQWETIHSCYSTYICTCIDTSITLYTCPGYYSTLSKWKYKQVKILKQYFKNVKRFKLVFTSVWSHSVCSTSQERSVFIRLSSLSRTERQTKDFYSTFIFLLFNCVLSPTLNFDS